VTVEGTVRVEFDAQHVINSDKGNYGAEQIGSLRESCAHEQASVTAAHDREMAGRGGISGR